MRFEGLEDRSLMAVTNVVAAGGQNTFFPNEGQTFTLQSSTFTDDADTTGHTAQVDWGDGTVESLTVTEPSAPGQNGTVAGATHVYADGANMYNATVTVFGANSSMGDSFSVFVQNVAPVANAGGPYRVAFGGTVQLNGSATDVAADQGNLIYAWDLDANGSYGNAGDARGDESVQNPIFNAAGLAAGTVFTVRLEVTDKDGDLGTTSTTVTVNNPPTLTTTSGSVSFTENGAAVTVDSGLTLADADAADVNFTGATVVIGGFRTGDVLGFTLSGGVTGGAYDADTGILTLSGTASQANYQTVLRSVTLENTGDNPGTARIISFTVSDGLNARSGTRSVSITPVNDAPTINSGGAITLSGTNENAAASSQTLVSTILSSVNRQDADTGALSGIAVTATSNSAGGQWQYSTDGSTWAGFGGVSLSAALLLTSTSRVRYVPDGKNGETATFTFRAWDQTDGTASINEVPSYGNTSTTGGASAYSSQSRTASMTITSVNDAPTLTDGAVVTLTATDEDATSAATAVSAILTRAGYADVDTEAISGIAVIAQTGNGIWQYSTNETDGWTDFGATDDANSLLLTSTTLVRYVPDGRDGETPTFTFRAWDTFSGTASINGAPGRADTATNGGATAFSSQTASVALSVAAVNDLPTSTDDAATTDEDVTPALSKTDFGSYSDVDSTSLAEVRITTLPTVGSLEFDTTGLGDWSAVSTNQVIASAQLDDQRLRFRPFANANGSPYATIGFKVGDGTAFSTNAYTLTINVTAVDDAPTVSSTSATNITLNAAVLGATVIDVDGGTAITKRGILYSATNNNPTLGGDDVIELIDAANATGAFSASLTGLETATTYAFVGYVVSDLGTVYSAPVSTFTTGSIFTVTTDADAVDANDGAFSLREAIIAANATAAADTITFDPALFVSSSRTINLSTAASGTNGYNADGTDNTAGPSSFGIHSEIKIVGPSGNYGLTIANSDSLTQRLFYVAAMGSLTLEKLTLTGGRAQGGDGGHSSGGAAGMGGAIFNQGALSVLYSTMNGNLARGGDGGYTMVSGFGGGGLGGTRSGHNGGGPNGGGSGGNGGFGGGGGFFGNGGFGGGGGARGTGGFGGGGGGGGGTQVGGFGGGGGASTGGGGAGMGGAIFNAAGTLFLSNSTLAGNQAQGGDIIGEPRPQAGSGYGGALFSLNGGVTILNSTLASNTVAAGTATGGGGGSAAGGALYTLGLDGVVAYEGGPAIGAAADAQMMLVNSIFANSTGGTDLVNNNSTLSGSNNLDTGNDGASSAGTTTTSAELNLGSLAANGGPTATIALGAGGVALNAGIDTTQSPYALTTDQRGSARKTSSGVDIGAYEAQPPAIGGVTVLTEITDQQTATPFSGVTIDAIADAQVIVKITFDAAKGAFTADSLAAAGFTPGIAGEIGTGSLGSFSTVNVQQAIAGIRQLVFAPTPNRVAPGAFEETTFRIDVDQSTFAIVTNLETVVRTTSVNDAPTISGITPLTEISDKEQASPFTEVTINDPDGQTLTVIVSYDAAAKGAFDQRTLNDLGFEALSDVAFRIQGSAEELSWKLQLLRFFPTENRVLPGLTEDTIFTIQVDDGVAEQVSDSSTVVRTESVNDAPTVDLGVVWTRQFGGTGSDAARTLARDRAGNLYVGGARNDRGGSGRAMFSSIFKFDPTGDLLWTQDVGLPTNASRAIIEGATADDAGNVFVTGAALLPVEGTDDSQWDAFVLKYDTDGHEVWTRTFGGTFFDIAHGVVVDSAGTIYAFGYTDNYSADNDLWSQNGFVSKIDADGNPVWTREIAGSAWVDALSAAVDSRGNVYVGGAASGDLEGVSAGRADAFLRKYDAAGAPQWTRQFGSAGDDSVYRVLVDTSGEIHAAGQTNGDLQGTSYGRSDLFVRQFDDAGNTGWTQQFGTVNDDPFSDATVDREGNVYFASGSTNGRRYGGRGGSGDAVVYKVGATGLQWRLQFGAGAYEDAYAVVVDDAGDLYVAGYTTGNLAQQNAGLEDGFLRKYSQITSITDKEPAAPFATAVIGEADFGQSLTVRVSLDSDAKGAFMAASLAASGFVDQTGGVYQFTGSAAEATTAIRQLVFLPQENRLPTGSVEDVVFTVSANDGLVATSVRSPLVVRVTSVNDLPAISINTLTISEGGAVTLSSNEINATDLDSAPDELIYTATAIRNGRFELITAPCTAITSFTQTQINAGAVRFVHNGSETSPGYSLTVSDGSGSYVPSPADIFFTNVDDGLVFEAEYDLAHLVGSSGCDAWQATAAADNAGYLSYGPYTRAISPGVYTASYRLKIGSTVPAEMSVATIDVWDAQANRRVVGKTLRGSDFINGGGYQDFVLSFSALAGALLEFRTYWHDTVDLAQDHVSVRPLITAYYSAADDLGNQIGSADGSAQRAAVGADSAGYLTYGPYATNIDAGLYTATYRLQLTAPAAPDRQVVQLDVYDYHAGRRLAQKILYGGDFTAVGVPQDFTLQFQSTDDAILEFRSYWFGTAGVKQEGVTVAPVIETVFEAELDLAGLTGAIAGDGRQTTAANDAAGYLAFGPYTPDIDTGLYNAFFRLQLGSPVAAQTPVATIDVWDAHAGKPLASKTLIGGDFRAVGDYQDFKLPFSVPNDDAVLEFRTYWHDAADLKHDQVRIASRSDVRFEAESDFYHHTGRSDLAGGVRNWSAVVNRDASGYLNYGPYTSDFERGSYAAGFRLAAGVGNANDVVAEIDVWDARADAALARRTLYRRDFAAANAFQTFGLFFDVVNGNELLEFRTYWPGRVDVKADAVSVLPVSPLQFEAETQLGHLIGRPASDGWSATVAQDRSGFLAYGPYTTAVPAGNSTAVFRLKLSGVPLINLSSKAATVDVWDATRNIPLATRAIQSSDFVAVNQYQDFNLDFVHTDERALLEFRTYFEGGADLVKDRVRVLPSLDKIFAAVEW